ncbi:DUF7373 family lipoprotein [Nocardia cyriacigeorgica]|nr:hypothetical protein [Nocardia cyriacigeorgica]
MTAVLTLGISVSLISGCADTSVKNPSAEVDISRLDAGNYPTKPQSASSLGSSFAGVNREAARLAEHVPLIMDIDRRLVFNQTNVQGRRYTQQQPPTHREGISTIENFNEAVPGLVVGWGTGGQRREERSLGASVNLRLLRFQTAAQATHAFRILPDAYVEKNSESKSIDIPLYSDARSYATPFGSVNTWYRRDNYLIYISCAPGIDPTHDPAPAVEMTKKVLDKQLEMLTGYQPTPVEDIPRLPADIDGLLARTLPVEQPDQESLAEEDVYGVYPVRSGIHLSRRFDLDRQAFEDAGVDLISRGDSWVYRAKDDSGAARLVAALIAQVDWQYKPAPSPPGMPGAKCFVKNEDDPFVTTFLMAPTCYYTVGRHVAVVEAEQVQALHQKAAAQYLLLAN